MKRFSLNNSESEHVFTEQSFFFVTQLFCSEEQISRSTPFQIFEESIIYEFTIIHGQQLLDTSKIDQEQIGNRSGMNMPLFLL